MSTFDEAGLLQLAQKVRTLDENENCAYENLLNALQSVSGSPSALFFTAFEEHDAIYLSNKVYTTGDSITGEIMEAGAGGLYEPSYDVRQPSLDQVGRWTVLRTVLKGDLEAHRMYADYYRAPGFDDHLRMLVYDHGRFAGWVGVFKRGPLFSRRTRRKMKRWAAATEAVVLALEGRARMESPVGVPGRLLLDAEGILLAASSDADRWCNPGYRSQISSLVRSFDRGGRGIATMGRTRVSLLRLDGASGVRYLADCALAIHPQMRPTVVLSNRQNQIGALAADGWTANRIADELGIRPHTVRQQLKSIYDRLGVANRLELRSRFR